MAKPHHVTYVAFDLETTGLVAGQDRIVEIGAVKFTLDGAEVGRFETLVNPQRPMSPSAQAIHGLSDDDLRDAPTSREVLPSFLDYLGEPGEALMLAHNAWFDAGFLGSELALAGLSREGYAVADTLALARRKLPGLPSHRLETLARILKLDPAGAHRALADALRVKDLWLALQGPTTPVETLMAYPLVAEAPRSSVPVGWEAVAEAIKAGRRVRMEYTGGSRGCAPREVTPRAFQNRGGTAYLVAFCHIDLLEKSFRLDRVQWYEEIGLEHLAGSA